MNIHQYVFEKILDYEVFNFLQFDFLQKNIEFLFLNFTDNHIFQFVLLSSFLILLGLGFSNRLIIFNDGLDFFQTTGIIIIPIVGYFFVMFTIQDNVSVYDRNIHFEENYHIYIISLIIGLFFIFSTIATSIFNNGFFFGITISIFKLIICCLLLISIIGLLAKDDKQKKRRRPFYQTIFFIFIFGWLTSKLINGEKVRKKREQRKKREKNEDVFEDS